VNDGSVAAGAREESMRAAASVRPLWERLMTYVRFTCGLRHQPAPQLIR
jgi:hypothetical protein